MEIRTVINKVENEYPKMKQMSKKNISINIPNKWLKIGLSSLGISIIMKSNVFALDPAIPTAGVIPNYIEIPLPVKICNEVCPIVQIAAVAVLIITGLSILTTKLRARKQDEPKKVKKWVKILFIISIVVFILSILAKYIINEIL